MSIVLWFLTRPILEGVPAARRLEQLDHSFAGPGRATSIEPLIKPIGFDWRIGIGLASAPSPPAKYS